MKFFHLADLHFGKSLHGYSLIDQGDQPAWADRFLELVDETRPDAVLISGDVYDRSVPTREAVALLDRFLTSLADKGVAVLLIAGNHDSGPRLNFASALLEKQNIHISGNIGPELRRVTLSDEHGPVHFYLMPYLFPAAVEEALGMEDIHTYDAAARELLARQNIDPAARNVLLAHQLVLSGKTAPETGGSETMVGGVGQIDVSAFDSLDYVALGHIHRPQPIGRDTVRYAGSPMCYHFSEIGWKKGALLVEMGEKGELDARMIEIPVLHPLREIRGELKEIIDSESRSETRGEYIRVVLTDDDLPAGAVDALSALFRSKESFLMDVAREERSRSAEYMHSGSAPAREKPIDELFHEFYRLRRNGEYPSSAEQSLIRFASEQIMNAPEDLSAAEEDALAAKLVAFALRQEGER